MNGKQSDFWHKNLAAILRFSISFIEKFAVEHLPNKATLTRGYNFFFHEDYIHDVEGETLILVNTTYFKSRTIRCRNYSKYCATKFNDDLSSVSWDNLSKCRDVNDAWLNLKTSFTQSADKHAPLVEKKVRGRNTPWLSSEIKNVMKERLLLPQGLHDKL